VSQNVSPVLKGSGFTEADLSLTQRYGSDIGLNPSQANLRKASRPSADSGLRILFVALVNNVGCERVIADMANHGAVCALMSPPGYYCAHSRAVAHHFSLPKLPSIWLEALFVRRRLEAAARDWQPDLVVPLDDIAAWLLRSLAIKSSVSQSLRDLLVSSFGSPSGYTAAVSRQAFMEVASRLGVRKPHHLSVDALSEFSVVPGNWDFPLFVKTEHSCGGDGVTTIRDHAVLRERLQSKSSVGPWRRFVRKAKRLLRAKAGFLLVPENGIFIQSFARGVPAFRTVAAWNGRVIAGVSFAAECIHPKPTGASTVVRLVNNREMDDIAVAVTAELGCSGFVSYDFLLDEEQGRATLIEMNPRCVGSCHLGKLFGHDVCGALMAYLTGAAVPERPALSSAQRVALFPKELERDPSSRYLQSSETFHDVPHSEPALIAAYLRRLVDLHPARANEIIKIVQDSSRSHVSCSLE
jgi:hypothetical protein